MSMPKRPVWFITGCSSGIGRAFAFYAFSTLSHRVVATARNPHSLDYLPSDNPNVLKLPLDVTSEQAIDAAIAAALKHFGRIDILVNNAGINRIGVTEAIPESELREIMEVDFWGVARLTMRFLKVFREDNVKDGGAIGGRIVQISSMGGRIVFPGNAGYHAAKHALEAFTETIAQEVQPEWNIKFLIVEPGGTKSEFVAGALQNLTIHPAYNDPNSMMNHMFQLYQSPDLAKGFAPAEAVAKVVWETLQKSEMPLRLPTGADSWSTIRAKEDAKSKQLDEWKSASESVGGKIWS